MVKCTARIMQGFFDGEGHRYGEGKKCAQEMD